MLPGKTFSPADIAAMLVRRRWLVLLPLAIGLALPAITSTLAEPIASGEQVRMQVSSVAAGAAAGFVLGLALVTLVEYRHSGFSSDLDVLRVLALPVLGTVPVMTSARERRHDRYRRVAIDLAGGLVVASAVLLVTWRLRF